MLHQVLIGSAIIFVTIIASALAFWLVETVVRAMTPWTLKRPHTPKILMVLAIAIMMVLALLSVSVWIWALAFLSVGVFQALEPSVYFSLVAFTTLGYGDVILPPEWRILGGMAAANGLLNMGFITALMVETMRQVRLAQARASARDNAS